MIHSWIIFDWKFCKCNNFSITHYSEYNFEVEQLDQFKLECILHYEIWNHFFNNIQLIFNIETIQLQLLSILNYTILNLGFWNCAVLDAYTEKKM